MGDRRNWSIPEEEALVTILQAIVVSGGRCDNGTFRTGTYDHIVMKMREKFPEINLSGKHVHNKIKRMKEKYSAALDMMNTSGFGWNDAQKCVTADPRVLEEYLKKHPNRAYVANKPFPQFERLQVIFGKNRATGLAAETASDALRNMDLENEPAGMETFPTSPNAASASSTPVHSSTSSKKRKRKVNVADEALKLIEKGLNSVSDEMSKLVEVIGTPGLEGIPDELGGLGFDMDQVTAISMYFADNPIQLRLWRGMNMLYKPSFIMKILEKLGM